MATLTQLIVETNALLGDSAGNRWLTAVANPPVLGTNDTQYLLNLAAVEFVLRTGIYRVQMPVQVTKDDPVVKLLDPEGRPPFGKLLRLEDQNGVAIRARDVNWLNVTTKDNWRTAPSGVPEGYIRGIDGYGTVRLYPPPADNFTYQAWVVGEPVPMLIGTDLPWIGNGANLQDSPAQYHSDLPFYAAWFGLLMNTEARDFALAKEYKGEFDMRSERAAADVQAAMAA